MMDAAYFDNLWKPSPSLGQNMGSGSASFWDGRADHFNTNAHRKDGARHRSKLLALLAEKGMLTPKSSVLDIGCGPGKYAVEMARVSQEVVGIDISSKMLAYAENHKSTEKLDNLHFLKLDWEQVSLEEQNWAQRFDLVFASMSPAINGLKALEKMIRASRGYCFMSTFAQRQESIRDRLAEELLTDWDLQNQGKGVYCCFNLLWLKGFYPEVAYVDTQWDNTFSFEEAVEYYSTALPIPGGASKAQKEYLRNYLRQQQDHQGLITEQVQRKIAWIFWKV